MSLSSTAKRNSTARAINATAFLLTFGSLFVSASVIMSQTPPRREVVYTSAMPVPPGATAEDFEPPPTPLEVMEATQDAMGALQGAIGAARSAIPAIPWNEHGLAKVEILPDAIRFDEARQRYVADLPNNHLAVLTLDVLAQRRMEALLSRYSEPGEAAVVVEAESGRVLVLADGHTGAGVGPGLARRSPAFAASTFKVITGAALIAEGHAEPDTTVCFTGGMSGFSLTQLDATETSGNCETLTEAMSRSSNLVFGRLADRHLTPEVLQRYADAFGYNRSIPFEMPLERSRAVIPDDSRLEFGRSAAGFRHTWLTPLHGAMIQAAIANQGVMMVPTIVDRIEDGQGGVLYEHEPVEWRTVLSPEVAAQVEITLERTCTHGTARNFFAERDGWPADVRVFGKTGTLSNRPVEGPEPDPLHTFTWFTGYAPHDGGHLAVAGLVVNEPTWWIKGSYLAAEAVLATAAQAAE
jgi:peptidoglycan glycosyltransferase